MARLRAATSAWLKGFKGRKGRGRLARLRALTLRQLPQSRRSRVFAGGGLLILITIVGLSAWVVNRPLDFGTQPWVIEPGDTLGKVAAQLVERDVIDQALQLRVLARMRGLGRQVRAGEYRFPPDTSLWEFLTRVVNGKGQVGIKVTIIEGWTFQQMRAHLRRAPKLKQVTAAMSDRQVMAELGHPELHPEGRFFPDTYYYTSGQTDLSIYRKAFHLMQEKLDAAWETRTGDLRLADKDEALIMASIIEKESWIAEEQHKIAGVFYNRLKKGMRLQTDPTVIYGLGANFDGNLTRTHLKADTPYNTYTRKGLPPTPISLPAEDALKATVRPARTDAYYFVASGGGWHHFSETLAQHNKAVWKYVRGPKNRRKN